MPVTDGRIHKPSYPFGIHDEKGNITQKPTNVDAGFGPAWHLRAFQNGMPFKSYNWEIRFQFFSPAGVPSESNTAPIENGYYGEITPFSNMLGEAKEGEGIANMFSNTRVLLPYTHFDSNSFYNLNLRAKSVTLPGMTLEKITTHYKGSAKNYPGRTTFNNIRIAFEDMHAANTQPDNYKNYTQAFSVKNFIRNWMDVCSDISNITSNRIYSVLDIFQCDHVGNRLLDTGVRVYNVWPESESDIDLTYDGNDIVRMDVTFSYDYWEHMISAAFPKNESKEELEKLGKSTEMFSGNIANTKLSDLADASYDSTYRTGLVNFAQGKDGPGSQYLTPQGLSKPVQQAGYSTN